MKQFIALVTPPFNKCVNEKATHALVFMVHGIYKSWKQPVAYFFTGNSIPGNSLWEVIY